MKGFFNQEGKFMSALSAIGDFMILNILFLLCCIPVVTIGAAQAGMYTAMRVFTDKEDDSSVIKAFFRGFANGFGTVTVAFTIMLVMMAMVGFSVMVSLFGNSQPMGIFAVISLVGFLFCGMFQSLLSAFHSRFRCTVWQLFRNSWLLFLAQPFRCLAMAVLLWSPVLIFFFFGLKLFWMMAPVFLGVYFSLIYWMCFMLLKKPFQKLEQLYREQQEEAEKEQ